MGCTPLSAGAAIQSRPPDKIDAILIDVPQPVLDIANEIGHEARRWECFALG
jgi:hypothetical protein